MDVVAHYSPPSTFVSSVHASSYQSAQGAQRRSSLPPVAGVSSLNRTPTSDGTNNTLHQEVNRSSKGNGQQQGTPPSATFNRAVQISLMEPVGSMSLSPANRDVVLAARKGLFILDLENPYDQPRFLPHLTTWVPADVQWNPHPSRANWVASTSNNKLLVWNLDRPAAHRVDPILSVPLASGTATSSSATSPMNLAATPSTNLTGTLPHVPGYFEGAGATGSRSSSISYVLNAHTRAITDINWSPFHPEILASCGIDTWMWAWDLREPSRPKQGYSAWNAAMTQVKWNRASPHRLATSCDNKVLIWDDRKGALPLATIEAAQSRIYGIDWSRDTSLGLSRLVTCSLDGSVKWWDLDSPAAQQAIGERRLVTEAETTIETHTPVWRARHLPFGNGVMTLPQRGDTSLGMWAKDKPEEPVHRFEGHGDIVKEYLIRTQGGSDRERDDRKFQLITWSKDQTLRLWPISEDMMKAVGHQRNTAIRVLQTRINAPNVSYRVPPFSSPTLLDVPLAASPQTILKSPASSANVSILPPSGVTHPVLSGSGHASAMGSAARTGTSGPGSPLGSFVSPTDRRQGISGSFGSEAAPGPFGSLGERRLHKAISASQLAVSQPRKPTSAEVRSSVIRRGGDVSLEARKHALKRGEKKQRRRAEIVSKQTNYMTRGTGGQGTGQLRALPKGGPGRGAALDAVGWIAGVRMGNEEKGDAALDTEEVDACGAEADEDEPPWDAAQVLGEEIKAVSRNVSGATFEKIDVSTRSCTATCYGPWAGKNVACFLRITLTFPPLYPSKAPRFELEHNASVSLKTRAFLLRSLSSIFAEATVKQPPEPSMEACLRFLLGETLDDDSALLSGFDGFWLPGDETDEEEEQQVPALKMPPRRSGATFGPDGQLVTFRPGTKMVQVAETPSAALGAEWNRAFEKPFSDVGASTGGARFLHSYTALSGAMTSLARLAKEGVAVQDLDVVQLMADQNFLAKRIHNQGRSSSKAPPESVSRRGDSRGNQALQDRLGYVWSTHSRPSSGSRSARRARSASPFAQSRIPTGPLLSDETVTRTTNESRSLVHIWNVAKMQAMLPSDAPPLVRRRSNSMPSSPAALTPRSERTFKLSSLAVPVSLNAGDGEHDGVIPQRQAGTALPSAGHPSWSSSASQDSESESDDGYGASDSEEEPTASSLLRETQHDAMNPVLEQVLDTIIWTMPFGFLFLMMDVMIQQQYGMHPTFFGELTRLSSTMPILTVFVYATAVRPQSNRTGLQLLMFFVSTACGSSFLYVYARSGFEVVVRQVAPLGTLWLYSLVRLDLSGVLLSLSLIWAFVAYHDLPVLS